MKIVKKLIYVFDISRFLTKIAKNNFKTTKKI